MNGVRKTTVMLAIVLGVLVAAAGAFVALFLVERSAAGDVNSQITVTERELDDARGRLADSRSTMDELDDQQQDLEDANDALRACADPTKASIEAVQAGDDAELDKQIDQMLLHCGR